MRRAGAALVVLLIAFLTSELALRVLEHRSAFFQYLLYLPGEPPRYELVDDVRELVAIAPFHPPPFARWGGFKLNSLGFASAEYVRTRPPGTFRLIALGDSFAFDSSLVPPALMWHHRVGDAIRARTGRPVEVISFGMSGVGPRFSLRMFEVEGRHLAPDLVLLSLYVGNDLTDETGARGSPLMRWSYTWRLAKRLHALRRRAERLGAIVETEQGPGGYPIPGYVYDPEAALYDAAAFTRTIREEAELFRPERRSEIEGWMADVVRTTASLDAAVQTAGSRLVVLLVPSVVQVDPTVRELVATSGATYDFDWLQRALGARLGAAGVTAVDLLPAFRAAPPTPRLYRRRDTHWSAAGNALAAERLAAFLAD